MIMALAFRFATYEADWIRQRMLDSLCERNKKGVNLSSQSKATGMIFIVNLIIL